MNEKILIIDDEPVLLTLLQKGLELEGFTVITADNGEEGFRKASEARPDAIILDVVMPEPDGWQTCQQIRRICDTPIILFTARANAKDSKKGFSLGADDYLTKPCSFGKLKDHIQTALKKDGSDTSNRWEWSSKDGSLQIDLRDGTVRHNGEDVHLTPTESRLLAYLASRPGQIVPYRELLVNVWGPEYADETYYLSVYIRYLRQKIEDDPEQPHHICAHRNAGYYFAANGHSNGEG